MKAYIIEDEPHAQSALEKLVRLVAPDVEIIGSASNVKDAVRLLKKQLPDFIFLDIRLGDTSAFELLKQVPPINFSVLFVTAYTEYALDAFQWNAVHYLVKPINSQALRQGIDRIRAQRRAFKIKKASSRSKAVNPSSKREEIMLRYESFIERQALDKVIRLEANGSLTFFFCLEKDLLSDQKSIKRKAVSSNIGRYDTQLNSDFYRCHQSHMVNRRFVKLYHKSENYLLLMDGTQIPVSRRGREKVEAWLANKS